MITLEERAKIAKKCEKFGIVDYTINDDGTIDVDNYVDFSEYRLNKIPLRFNKVRSDFMCDDIGLTTLEGCPVEVGGNFDCAENKLTSLKGGPIRVGGFYACEDNELDTLYGMAKEIGFRITCDMNFLSDEIILYFENVTTEEFMIFMKYEKYYDVFSETEINEENFNLLLEDIKDGLE